MTTEPGRPLGPDLLALIGRGVPWPIARAAADRAELLDAEAEPAPRVTCAFAECVHHRSGEALLARLADLAAAEVEAAAAAERARLGQRMSRAG